MLLCSAQWMCAQELKCTVTVNSDKVEGSSKSMFEALQQSLTELLNNTRWTNLVFAEQEVKEMKITVEYDGHKLLERKLKR